MFLSNLLVRHSSSRSKRTVSEDQSLLQDKLGACYDKASEAFGALVGEGFPPEELVGHLEMVGVTSHTRSEICSGMTDKQVKNLPGRIERFADEIQRLNQGSGLLYYALIEIEAAKRMLRAEAIGNPRPRPFYKDHLIKKQEQYENHVSLPALLRDYSAYLKTTLEEDSNRKKRKLWTELQEETIAKLKESVRSYTGRDRNTEVSHLLKALFLAAGRTDLENKISPDQQKQLAKRLREQRHLPPPRGARV
jgi:hypothetical protein